MNPIPINEQQALVERLMKACGGAYSPNVRRKYFLTGPQWAAAYEGNALFHAPTRTPVGFETVIEKYAEVGIGYWCTHDTDVIAMSSHGRGASRLFLGSVADKLIRGGEIPVLVYRPLAVRDKTAITEESAMAIPSLGGG